jgi:hypothetical protein
MISAYFTSELAGQVEEYLDVTKRGGERCGE